MDLEINIKFATGICIKNADECIIKINSVGSIMIEFKSSIKYTLQAV